jgi:4-amino-4-deoxy-L-arabinose transferase-like glycosyltransferase
MTFVSPHKLSQPYSSSYRKLFLDASNNSNSIKGSPKITSPTSTSEQATQSLAGFAKKHQYRLLLLVFLIGFAIATLYNLGYMSVQWDEMPHLYGATMLFRGQTWDYMTTYGYYPPIFDLVTTGFFQVFGATQVAGRLVAVTFSLLAIGLLFEFTKRTYGQRNALIASIFLGTMPGFFWLSRVTMLETMLIFFLTLAMFAFYSWITKDSNKALIFSGLTLGIGVLAKYQIVVAALAMLLSILDRKSVV